jgi:hypothetical protein
MIPTSPWKTWEGRNPGVNRMIALVSSDRCRTWEGCLNVMVDPSLRLRFWESKIVELPDGRLCAAAWVHDEPGGIDLPNHYALSADRGRTWTAPAPAGLFGQTLTPFALRDGRILSVYRRMDRPGLWANLSRIEGDAWINEMSECLWGPESSASRESQDMAAAFRSLKFGAPCIIALPDGALFAAFWVYEDNVSVIRRFTFMID